MLWTPATQMHMGQKWDWPKWCSEKVSTCCHKNGSWLLIWGCCYNVLTLYVQSSVIFLLILFGWSKGPIKAKSTVRRGDICWKQVVFCCVFPSQISAPVPGPQSPIVDKVDCFQFFNSPIGVKLFDILLPLVIGNCHSWEVWKNVSMLGLYKNGPWEKGA